MEMFALDSVVAAQEQVLLDPAAPGQCSAMLALAWQLRQRDSHRAQALCQQVQAALPQLPLSGPVRARWQARLCLINGELDWLFARLDAAGACLRLAMASNDEAERLEQAEADGDSAATVGYGSSADGVENRIDAQVLQGWLALDLGVPSQATQAWSEAMALATQAGDSLRCRMVQAMQAYWHVLSDRHAAREKWGGLFIGESASGASANPALHAAAVLAMPPALLAPVEDYFSVQASLDHDFGASITHGIAAWEAALASGQIRRAICSATSIGDDFNNLGDSHSALEWMQRALALARPSGWPGSVGLCLAQLGGTLRRLGRFDDAALALQEAMQVMVQLQASRNYGVALAYLGDLAQDCGRHAEALAHFRLLEQRAIELGQLDFHIHACCAQITALAELGQGRQALDKGLQTLDIAIKEQNQPCQIEVLKAMAEVYQSNPALPFLAAGTLPLPELPCAPGPTAADSRAELTYLLQAYAVAQGVAGFAMPLDLLDNLANVYDRQGDARSAFQYTREANQVREALHGLEAGNRAIAMQVRHKTERARTEGEHHRQLAIAEAQRAETLQQTSTMLAHLGAVGQEITTHLDAQAVFLTLNRHVLNLLDASGFSVYLCDDDGLHLSRAFGLEAGNPLPPVRLAIADPNARASRCAREQREFLFDLPQPGVTWLPGTLVNRSALFAPLRLRERVLGVMAVQSLKRHAWDERALLIFRTLCAYGAIALDNAQAYLRLQEAQAKLVAKEKLAALGALVAGVAHELNTPLGNSLMMASALEEKSRQFDARVKSGQLLLDDLLEFLAEAREAAILIMRGLSSAADLVNSFKQVAVDRTSAQWREFDLQQTIHEIIATMATRIRQAGHAIELDVAPGINLYSYPGPLGQVITNLVNNALLHAFDGKSGGQILLVARQMPEQWVRITFSDDGHGIPEQNLTRIFDPFFTTRMGQGGSGLGLSICYNIITSILNGQISVSSSAMGTRFVLDLPLVVACPHEDAVLQGDLA